MKKHTLLFFTVMMLLSCNNSKSKETQIVKEVITHTNTESKSVIEKVKTEIEIATKTTIVQNQQPFIQNSNTKIGVINDSDGFTNLRLKPNTSSEILQKIKENQYFFFNEIESSDWVNVKDLYGYVGYIHESRVELVDNDNLFNMSFSDNLAKEESVKDTIVNLKDLDVFFETNFYGTTFNYDKIELTTANDSSAIYSNDDTQIKISRTKFESKKHQFENHKEYDNFIEKIDGNEIWGTDGNIPRFEISEIKITQNLETFIIPKEDIKNLFEPRPKDAIVYKAKDKIIISMMNSDAAGAYQVVFIVKNKKFIKRIVFIPF